MDVQQAIHKAIEARNTLRDILLDEDLTEYMRETGTIDTIRKSLDAAISSIEVVWLSFEK